MTGQPPTITDIDVEQYKNPEFGLSTYDSYADGAGVSFVSYRRPILNLSLIHISEPTRPY